MVLLFEWPLNKDFSRVIYPRKSKARIIAALLFEKFKKNQGFMSKHKVSEFCSDVQTGKYLWRNAEFKASRKYVYAILKGLVKMGMVQFRVGRVGSDWRQGYFLEFTEFEKRLLIISRRWRKEFVKDTKLKNKGG